MGRDFRKLAVYRLGYNLVLDVYPLLEEFPESESRNLSDQLRRALTSSVLNIVEGASSRSHKVFLNHLSYAYGSAREVDVLLCLARDLGYVEKEVFSFVMRRLEEFKACLYRFMQRVEADADRPFTYNPPKL